MPSHASEATFGPAESGPTGRFWQHNVVTDPAMAAQRGCKVALLGLPDDLGVRLNNGRPGASNGPAAFRSALSTYGVAHPAGGPPLPLVFDAGDVTPASGSDEQTLHQTHHQVSEATTKLLRAGYFPIAVGGGHDLTYPFVRAVIEHSQATKPTARFAGLYFDAHLDVRPTVGSGMPFRRLIETCGRSIVQMTVMGLNPLANHHEHASWFGAACGGRNIIHGLDGCSTENVRMALSKGEQGFVSFDLDAIDAAHAPGVSALNPSGLTGREATTLMAEAASQPGVRCIDIMELSPPHDHNGRTARLAAHLFVTALAALATRL